MGKYGHLPATNLWSIVSTCTKRVEVPSGECSNNRSTKGRYASKVGKPTLVGSTFGNKVLHGGFAFAHSRNALPGSVILMMPRRGTQEVVIYHCMIACTYDFFYVKKMPSDPIHRPNLVWPQPWLPMPFLLQSKKCQLW